MSVVPLQGSAWAWSYPVVSGQRSVRAIALEMAVFAGGYANAVKKLYRDGKIDRDYLGGVIAQLTHEVASAAGVLGATLGDVAQMNLDKLADRQRRGVLKGSGDDR